MVTDWNPLTVWAYQESYVRFAATDYDAKSTSKFGHLTNNCVVKKFLQKEQYEEYGSEAEDEEPEFDNIWSSDEFGGHLNKEFGANLNC